MKFALLTVIAAITISLPVYAQAEGGDGPFVVQVSSSSQSAGMLQEQSTQLEAGTSKTAKQLEGERLGYALGKAIIDYSIMGIGGLLGFLFVKLLTRKPKKAV